MDPRRKIDEKWQRLETGKVPFIELYREIVLEEQPIGQPIEREIIVLRINKASLKLNLFLGSFILILVVFTVFQS